MNDRSSTASGPEPYWKGVRRRVRTSLFLAAVFLVEMTIAYATYGATQSIILAATVAVICGGVGQALDLKFDPLFDPRANSVVALSAPRNEKTIWLLLFVPAIVGLAAVLVYLSILDTSDLGPFGAIFVGIVLGSVLGSTAKLLRFPNRSGQGQ